MLSRSEASLIHRSYAVSALEIIVMLNDVKHLIEDRSVMQ